MPRLFVALPAYNEEACLPPLLKRFKRLFEDIKEWDPQVIVVDDGSADGTAKIVQKAEKKGYPCELVSHEQNKGLGEAIKTGLRRAAELSESDDDVLVCMDADNTHPPRYVKEMFRVMNETHADIVIASRYRKGSKQIGVPPHRMLMSYGAMVLFKIFLRLPKVRDYTCGFRAYRMGLVRASLEHYGDDLITRSGFACTDQLIVNMALFDIKIREIPFILRYDRKEGDSKLQLGTTILETFHLLWSARQKLKEEKLPRP